MTKRHLSVVHSSDQTSSRPGVVHDTYGDLFGEIVFLLEHGEVDMALGVARGLTDDFRDQKLPNKGRR